ncbi:MAG: tetratricopeptide repeat protein [Phycisphaerales bacterium]|nr:tetratricopeptide repeat protein [Phycisphaerales bacterium]MCB9856035.1 tetratricopeptide repeat protein [Phycisphaerales bacterium]MCB9863937.1 tetratricopeptide repeat protein [Phycisphaerales bacterium]
MPSRPGPFRISRSMQGFVALVAILAVTGVIYQELLESGIIDAGDRTCVAVGRHWAGRYDRLMLDLNENLRDNWSHVFDIVSESGIQQPPNTGGFWQPLVAVSFAIDASLAKNPMVAPFHYHLTNIALHLLNCALVFLLTRQFTKTLIWPVLLTLLFALHPVQVESIAWISQRMTLLSATFALLATNCYVRYAKTGHSRWMTPTFLFYTCILLSRPLYIALPGVFLILDIWPLKRHGWRTLVEKIPLFGMMLLGNFLDGAVRAHAQVVHGGGMEGVQSILHNFSSLVLRLVWPFDLSPYHVPETTIGTVALGTAFDVVVLALIIGALVLTFLKSKPAFVGFSCAALVILPALIQAPYSEWLLSDQYLYLALVIPCLCAAAWLGDVDWRFQPRIRQWAALATACVVAACGVGAYAQSLNWQSDRYMAEHSIELYPDRAFGYIALVEAYIAEHDYEAALHAAELAQKLEPENPSTDFYLGTVLLLYESNRSAQAIGYLESALKSDPNWIECLQNLGVALGRNGRTDEAIPYLERARDLDPASAGIRIGLGTAYLRVEKFADARREFEEALKRNNSPSAHLGLAIAWAANDNPDYAQRHLAVAVEKDPNVAFRAGRSPWLRRYIDRPGFRSLISVDPAANKSDGPITDSPTSFESGGSS